MRQVLPGSPRQLRGLLARRMGLAAIVIGLAAGGLSYQVEVVRLEEIAFERALASVRHFSTPAMLRVVTTDATGDHGELVRSLDRSRLVGIRVYRADRFLSYEVWADIPAALVEAGRGHPPDWPAPTQSAHHWIDVAGERLVRVVLPLPGNTSEAVAYLEGVTRVDAESLRAQKLQARDAALTAILSVLLAALLLYPLLLRMLRRSATLAQRLLDANLSLMRSLGNAVAKRDSETDAHNYRVTLYAVALAEVVGLSKAEIADLVVGAFLHDVGKIAIPDAILRKPGRLDAGEFEVMKTHVLQGVEIVTGNPWLNGAVPVIRHHHERFDGSGYPDGLAGEAIPQSARVFAVVDVFDALTSVRPYKTAIEPAAALAIVRDAVGTHFDPDIAGRFCAIALALHTRIALASDVHLRQALFAVLVAYFRSEVIDEPRTCGAGEVFRTKKTGPERGPEI